MGEAAMKQDTTTNAAPKKKTGGLAGIVAGETHISAAGGAHNLEYRGYSIYDLAENCVFEEVAYLIVYGSLPTQSQLDDFMSRLIDMRDLPKALKDVLELIPKDAHPMDVMRTATSFLGNIEPETEKNDQYAITERMIAAFPAALVYWWHFAHTGKQHECVTTAPTTAEHFLTLLGGKKLSDLHIKAMNVSLILGACDAYLAEPVCRA